MSRSRREYEAAMRKRMGPDPEKVEAALAAFNASADLFTTCQHCRRQVKGTLAELKAHTCG